MKNTFKISYIICLIFIISISAGIAQEKNQSPPCKAHQVKGNIYEVKGGSGANTAFFIGEKEVLVMDAKMSAESARQMIAEIKKLTPNPIKYIVLSHSDGDHVNGLVGFPVGLNIISHYQTRKDMDKAFKKPEQRLYLPTITFSKKLDLYMGNKQIKLFYFFPAHTSGDIVIFFPEEKVAFLGDLIFLGRDLLIHRHKNGSSFGLVKTLKGILKLDADTFIHGHGDIASRSDIEGVIKALEEKQTKIKSLIQEGKSLDEIKKIFNIEDRPAQAGRRRWLSLVEIIYLELTEKK